MMYDDWIREQLMTANNNYGFPTIEEAMEYYGISEEFIDKFNSIGCTSFQLTADEVEKFIKKKNNS